MEERPYCLSIAGLDPSGGAGLLADIKTFEQLEVYGFGVCTALTAQNASEFDGLQWVDSNTIVSQLEPLLRQHRIKACKVGIMKNLETLQTVLAYLKQKQPMMRIVLDPVVEATAGYVFHEYADHKAWGNLLAKVDVLTPNIPEMQWLTGIEDPRSAARSWAMHSAIYLKGGHLEKEKGTDRLFLGNNEWRYPAGGETYKKHGSGCILSAAMAAYLAKGEGLHVACSKAKAYTENALNSHPGLLSYHT